MLIRVKASLISPGTEINLLRQRRAQPDPAARDIPFGYANAGEIMAVNGDAKDLAVGMRVAAMGGGARHANYACVPVNLDFPASSRTGPGYHDEAWEYGRDYPAAFVPFTTQRNLREIICLLAERRLRVDPMITHRLPLTDVGRAADLLLNHPDQAMGVILQMTH